MITFREVRIRCKIDGFQCHHLIPVEVVERRAFAHFFGIMRAGGFNPNDFVANGMHLPSDEARAAVFRLPLHRGAHPRYNELVAERVAQFVGLKPSEARSRLCDLQSNLREGLRSNQLAAALAPRNPLRASADFRRLDSDLELLWGKTELGGADQRSLAGACSVQFNQFTSAQQL